MFLNRKIIIVTNFFLLKHNYTYIAHFKILNLLYAKIIMKKATTFLFVVMLLFMTSCYTISRGGKKPLFVVDAPLGLTVKANHKYMTVSNEIAFSETFGNSKTYYYYPGFLIKMRRHNNIQLQSKDKDTIINVKGTPGIGMLILETVFTFGIGTIIDISTNSFYFPKDRYIDVPAYLNGTKPRSQKELRRYVRSKNFSKVY